MRFSTKEKLFAPALIESIRCYNREMLARDLMSGIIVGIVALPLAIAFGIASGVSPEKGLITAIIGGFLVSLLGGSKVQIGGPTGAFIVIVYGIIETHGISGLTIATLMAGCLLLVLGFLKLGTVIRFIPYPIIVGFTSGIAVTIFSTQIKDLLGLQIESLPGSFIEKWGTYFSHLGTVDITSTLIGVLSIVIVFFTPHMSKKIPGSMIAIVLMTVAAYFVQKYTSIDIPTIGDNYTFKPQLPTPSLFSISWQEIQSLMPAAFTIAMLGAIESLLSASVADGVIGTKHDSNTELIAQGVANVVVPFFGGIPVTGAIARTMTNINNGGRSPIAGIVHAAVLLLILLFLGSLTAFIPMACLAGILVVVSYNMSEWKSFRAILRGPREDILVLLITFFLTVILDLTIAIGIGMIVALLLFMQRVYKSTEVTQQDHRSISVDNEVFTPQSEDELHLPDGVEVFEIQGPFFFGIANRFDEVTKLVSQKPQVRILRMRRVPFIDATGAHNLRIMIDQCHRAGIKLILSGINDQVRNTLQRTGLAQKIGEENICKHIAIAVERAIELIN